MLQELLEVWWKREMKSRNIKALITSLLCLLFLISCSTDVNTMINDYNTHYTKDTSKEDEVQKSPQPGDADFTEDQLLQDEYFVWEDATLNLAAPETSAEVFWRIYDPDDPTETPLFFHLYGHPLGSDYDVWNEKTLAIKIPDSKLEIDKVYKLTLQIVSKEGKRYSDSAALVIYRHLVLN